MAQVAEIFPCERQQEPLSRTFDTMDDLVTHGTRLVSMAMTMTQ